MNGQTTKAIKVYPSSIVPAGQKLEPVRDAKFIASSFSVELVHIIVFVTLITVIFGGLWKVAQTLGIKKEKAKAKFPATAEA